MGITLRAVVAILAGLVVSIGLTYAAAIVVVLVTIGIPLGSESRPLTTMQATLLLAAAAASSFVGGRLARRLVESSNRVVAMGLPGMLFACMLWAFSGRSSWPPWWGLAAGLVMAVGAGVGTRGRSKIVAPPAES